jgi:hypothetical protein
MSEKRLSGSIALSKLVHVRMNKKGKPGPNGEERLVEGIFIPLEANFLTKGEPNEDKTVPIYMSINVVVKDEQDKYKQNGFISKSVDSKLWKTLTDDQKEESKKASPILGSIKDWSASAGSTADSQGAASTETFDENDDLPF